MFPKLRASRRDAVRRRVISTAIKRPVVVGEPPPDDSGADVTLSAPQCDVGFAIAEFAKVLTVIELDEDLWVALVELAKDWREQGDGEDLLGGDAHRPAGVASMAGRGLGKAARRKLDLPGASDQFLTDRGQRIAGLALEEVRGVAVGQRGRGRGRAVDHHEPEGDQAERDEREDARLQLSTFHADRFCTSLLNSSPRSSKSRNWS